MNTTNIKGYSLFLLSNLIPFWIFFSAVGLLKQNIWVYFIFKYANIALNIVSLIITFFAISQMICYHNVTAWNVGLN